MAYNEKRHDIGLLRQDGTTKVGLMLAQDKNGVPYYQVADDEYLAQQFFAGVPGYGSLPPEKELAIRQDSWRAGCGLEVYDADDPERYRTACNMDLRHRGMAILSNKANALTPTDAPVLDIQEFDDELYFAGADTLFKLNGTGDGFTSVKDNFPDEINDLEVFQNRLYIALLGTNEEYWYMNAAESCTESTLTSPKCYARWFCTVQGSTLWKGVDRWELYSSTDPTNSGDWSSATYVDSMYLFITRLVSFDNSLYVMKEDRPFYLDSSGNVNVLTETTRTLVASDNGKHAIEWKGCLYMPWGAQGLLEYDAGTFTWLSPGLYCSNLSDFTGQVLALASDEHYLYAAIKNGAKTAEILAGRRETIDSTTKWVWHPIVEITFTNGNVETMYASAIYERRLWITSDNASDDIYYVKLPTGYGDVPNDDNRDFQTDGYFETPKLHGNFRGDNKGFIKIEAELGHDYDADIYFECWYKKQEDSSWTDAGDLKGTSSSRIATLYIPNDASDNEPVSRTIQFKFVGKTDDTTKTPILLGYDCRAILYPTKRRIISAVVRCADDITDKEGTKLKVTASDIKTILEEAADATWPVTFYDVWGDTKNVRVLASSPFHRIVKSEKNRNLEEWFYLNMEEVTLS